jgi:hypothetical protein
VLIAQIKNRPTEDAIAATQRTIERHDAISITIREYEHIELRGPFKVLLKKIGLLDDFGHKPIDLTLDQLLSLEVREDGGGGPNTISSRLLIQKRQ